MEYTYAPDTILRNLATLNHLIIKTLDTSKTNRSINRARHVLHLPQYEVQNITSSKLREKNFRKRNQCLEAKY